MKRDQHIRSLTKFGDLKAKLGKLDKQVKDCEMVFGFENTDKMIKVLRDLNFINESNIP